MVVEPVVVVVVPACTQLVYALAVLWTQPVRERAWAHMVTTLVLDGRLPATRWCDSPRGGRRAACAARFLQAASRFLSPS